LGWQAIEIGEEEIRDLERAFAAKSKFLADESVGQETIEVLREAGLNVKGILEIALAGRGDEDIYALAHKEDRILLSHDSDFLDDQRFPPRRNPGVVILPSPSGNRGGLVHALQNMLLVVGKYRELWSETKVIFSEGDTIRAVYRNRQTGAIEKNLFLLPQHGPPMLWADEDELG